MGDDGVLGESGELTETSWAGRVDAPGKVLRLVNNERGSWGASWSKAPRSVSGGSWKDLEEVLGTS